MSKTLSDYSVMDILSSTIRGCLQATPGTKMVVADLSNIEGRALAWLAREQWKLDAFAEFDTMQQTIDGWVSGGEWARQTRERQETGLLLDRKGEPIHRGHDLYALAYAKSFGVTPEAVMENKKTGDGSMRQIGKVQELACFGADTQVLTSNGLKAINTVTLEDLVWDGVMWVPHSGLAARGTRQTLSLAGIEVTPDHLIRTGATWTQAQQLATCESTLSQALATGSANLPSSVWSAGFWDPAWLTTFGWLVPAAPSHIWFATTTCAKAVARGATHALKKLLGTGARTGTPTQAFARTMPTVGACSTAFQRQSPAATAQPQSSTRLTAGAASTSLSLGAKTSGASWPTCSPWPAGKTQAMTWIASTWTKATRRATCVSSPHMKTGGATSAPSKGCNSGSLTLRPVFDLLNCGPRNRFTVMTSKGPLIVHNCGYEGGVGAFATFALVYGIDLDELPAIVLPAADPALVRDSRGFYRWLMEKKKGKNTYGMFEDTFVACDVIKRGWRLAHPQTASWWKQLEEAFRLAIDNPGDTFEARSVTVTRPCFKSGKPTQWTTITLPSGRRLCYPGARIEQADSSITYMGADQRTRKWSRLSTYSGKLAENVTQAFARDVLAYNMPLIEQQGYEIVLSVHDELLTESPISPEFSSDHLAAWMANVPPWAEGLPLAAAGFETLRYRKD
jgi:hypothetical protein